jgi:hypothetical protein
MLVAMIADTLIAQVRTPIESVRRDNGELAKEWGAYPSPSHTIILAGSQVKGCLI